MKNKKEDASKTPDKKITGEKSLNAAVEQMAKFLRVQIKSQKEAPVEKKRKTTRLPSAQMPASFYNSLEQIAQLLRKEIHKEKD